MAHLPRAAGAVQATEFPRMGSPAEKLRFALNDAVLAPSERNAQPWAFTISGDALALSADRSRAVPVVDPQDRELTISCGAALLYLRVAVRHFGYQPIVDVFPDPHCPDLLARVRLGGEEPQTPAEHRLFHALSTRRTHRQPFNTMEIPARVLGALQDAAQAERAWFQVVQGAEERAAIATLIAEGDRLQWADPAFRGELAASVHPNWSRSPDGLPGSALGYATMLSALEPLVTRLRDKGNSHAARDAQLALDAPTLAVLGTTADTPAAWLAAGQALGRVLLRARADTVYAAFFNQPIEIAQLRPRLGALLKPEGFPQILLRLGYGAEPPPTPRHAASAVVR